MIEELKNKWKRNMLIKVFFKDIPDKELLCLFKSFIEKNCADKSFERISEKISCRIYSAYITYKDIIDAHRNGQLIEDVPVNDSWSYFSHESFTGIGEFFKKVIGEYCIENCITQELKPLIVYFVTIRKSKWSRAVYKGYFINPEVSGTKSQRFS